MKLRERVELLLLAAIWGSSFLFMRVAAPEFGPLALIAVRVAVAALFLTGIMAWRRELGALAGRKRAFLVLGTVNSAVPFALFAYSTLSLPAGFSSVLNATAPLFGALIAYLWLRERMALTRTLGLVLGFVGVVALVWDKLTFAAGREQALACAAGLTAAVGYGFAAHFSKRHFTGVSPLATSAGSQIAASMLLAPFAFATWPATTPSTRSFVFALVLGVVCTGAAYLLYFRLIAQVGPARAMTVTYLIPLFGLLWGWVFLDEALAPRTLVGCALILGGTTLVLRRPSTASNTDVPNLQPCPSSPPRSAR